MQIPSFKRASNPSQLADFHIHTKTSDGSLSHTQVIDQVRQAGLGVAAVADHDSLSFGRDSVVRKYLAALGPAAPQMVPATEITCYLDAPLVEGGWPNVHIVGLGCNPFHPELRKALLRQRLGTDARIRAYVTELQRRGYDVQFGELGELTDGRALSEWTLAKLLVKRGYATSLDAARGLLFSPEFLASVQESSRKGKITPEEAIRLIRDAGGVAVLAHPHRNVPDHDPEKLHAFFARLSAAGLDAVETYRFDLPTSAQPVYRACAKKIGLLESGGSDFHDLNEKGTARHPGDSQTPAFLWSALEARIRARGGATDLRQAMPPPTRRSNAFERLLFSRKAG